MLKNICCGLVVLCLLWSCKKEDDPVYVQLRDLNEQNTMDTDSIEASLNKYMVVVDLTSQTNTISFKETTDSSLSIKKHEKIEKIEITKNGVDYKIYYLIIRDGKGKTPTRFDSLLVAYQGLTLDNLKFDSRPNEFWNTGLETRVSGKLFSLEGTKQIISKFKSGSSTLLGNGDYEYSDYGIGVMFIPSGLGYFEMAQTNLPSYSSFVVSFNLYDVVERDNDLDGVLNKDEDVNTNGDFFDDDTDGDGIANFIDTDDDGDGILTKDEYTIIDGVKNWKDYNTDGGSEDEGKKKPNYLDNDDDGVLTKDEYIIINGVKNWKDYDTNKNKIPNYLDPLDK